MLRIVDVTSETTDDLRCAVPRADFDVDAAMAAVIPVCSAVRDRGVEALREYSEKFDHVVPEHLRVPVEACLLYTSPSPRDATLSRMPSSA